MEMQLREWRPADADALVALCNAADRTYLSNRLPDPYTPEDAAWWLRMVAEHDGQDGIFRAITVDGRIVGNISAEQKSDVYCRDAEVGYLLLAEYQGRGIMTQALRQLTALAFEKLDIVRLTGLVYAPNTASCRVLEKNGFQPEGRMKNAVTKGGALYDLCIYGKCR